MRRAPHGQQLERDDERNLELAVADDEEDDVEALRHGSDTTRRLVHGEGARLLRGLQLRQS